MATEELKDYMKKQSIKTLKGLEEFYKNQIFEKECNEEEANEEKMILDAVKFELMVRSLKKVTKELNRKISI